MSWCPRIKPASLADFIQGKTHEIKNWLFSFGVEIVLDNVGDMK